MSSSGPIVVVGGGIAGISAALRLRKDFDVRLLEASDHVGGKLRTTRDQGYIFEWGPHSFLGSADHLFRLAEELRLDSELIKADSASRRRYVFDRGRLRPVPSGPVSLATTSLISPAAKVRALLEPWVLPRDVPQETAASFFTRRFGRRVAERLLAPFVSGIYAGDANELEMESAFPKLVELEREFETVIGGAIKSRRRGPKRRGTYSWASGMQTIADAASDVLGDVIRRRSVVDKLVQTDSGWRVDLTNGEILNAEQVVLAVPSHRAARILQDSDAQSSIRTVGGILAGIPYASVGLVQFGCATARLPRELDGFGFLTNPQSDLPILGCLWPSSVFSGRAPNGKVLMTAFLGGRNHEDLATRTPQERIDLARSSIGRALRGTVDPETVQERWVDQAIPQLVRGHGRRIHRIEKQLAGSGIALAGNYLRGVSVDHAAHSGQRAVEAIIESTR